MPRLTSKERAGPRQHHSREYPRAGESRPRHSGR